ncbi:CdaR family transcriptional regulator [Tuberibacillus sp. Marseille-P3662]|uniref:CdaR family transcriptional regulator n=1 Tax=Tuberibacillus sp. Marseille-P3662 TaxID=1965358 RepID=UPI001593DAD1|nr:sugar diacid recognition domain-containing protein [Tuberibacillus sp. Marseille-P3662]
MLTPEIAETIGRETMKTLGRNINIMDERGIILSSGDPERIDTFHEAANEVIEKGEALVIDTANQRMWRGTKPGMNLPIKFQGEVVGVVGISGIPEEVKDFGSLVVTMTELMLQQIYLMKQVEWQYRTREFLLEDILSEHPPYQKIEQKCRLLNININAPYTVFVYRLNQAKKRFSLHEVYDQVEHLLPASEGIYGFVGAETFVVILSSQTDDPLIYKKVQEQLSYFYEDVQTGIGRTSKQSNAIHRHYQETVLAMDISDQAYVKVSDYEAQLLLYTISQAERERYQHKVMKSLSKDLQITLSVFFANNLNLSRTAKQLFVHRNTLIYRIEKIQDLTGYDPRNFQDAVALQLADWC